MFAPQMRLPLKLAHFSIFELMTDKRRGIHGNGNITQPELSLAINKEVLERYFLNANLKLDNDFN